MSAKVERASRARRVDRLARALHYLATIIDPDEDNEGWDDLTSEEKSEYVALAHALIVVWKALNA